MERSKLKNLTGMILLWAIVIAVGSGTLYMVALEYMTHEGRIAFNMALTGYVLGNIFSIKSIMEDTEEDKKKEKHE